jgi:hypothetical protein
LANNTVLRLQTGRAGYPVAFGKHAHDLTVPMLADLPDQILAVVGRHPVFRLDLLLGVHFLLEQRFFFAFCHGAWCE